MEITKTNRYQALPKELKPFLGRFNRHNTARLRTLFKRVEHLYLSRTYADTPWRRFVKDSYKEAWVTMDLRGQL